MVATAHVCPFLLQHLRVLVVCDLFIFQGQDHYPVFQGSSQGGRTVLLLYSQ